MKKWEKTYIASNSEADAHVFVYRKTSLWPEMEQHLEEGEWSSGRIGEEKHRRDSTGMIFVSTFWGLFIFSRSIKR